MGEEWRLLIELDADGAPAPAAKEIVDELGEEIGLHRADGSLVAGLARLEPRVEHWSHDDQEWRDGAGNPGEPEEDEDMDEEPADSGPRTVVVSLSHHHEAKQLADQLRDEGWDASSSWHNVEIATRSPEEAESLVAELGARAPDADVAIAE